MVLGQPIIFLPAFYSSFSYLTLFEILKSQEYLVILFASIISKSQMPFSSNMILLLYIKLIAM